MAEEKGLLGFLQKKSLFHNDHGKNVKKRQTSRVDNDQGSIASRNKYIDIVQSPLSLLRDQEYSLSNIHHPTIDSVSYPNNNSLSRFTSFGKQSSPNANRSVLSRFQESKVRSARGQPEEHLRFTVKQQIGSSKVEGTFCMSFESARVESAQCLEALSLKLKTEIANVHYRIDEFRSNLTYMLSQQLHQLKQKIGMMVEEAFRESEKGIKEYMRVQQQRLAGDLLRLRSALEKEYLRIENMKGQIARSQWRKVAGEILSTGLEKNILELISQASHTSIGHWQKQQWSNQRLINLARQLRDVVRFRE